MPADDPDTPTHGADGVPEPVRMGTPLITLTGLDTDPQRARRRRRTTRPVVVLAVLGVVAVLVAVTALVVPRLFDDVSADAAGGPSSPLTGALGDPLGVGFRLLDLECSDDYVVVLASAHPASGTSDASFVQAPLRRFSTPEAPGHYLAVPESCGALRGRANKSGSAYLPYLGPYADPVTACRARMAHADTSTYVVRLSTTAAAASYCACVYPTADLPHLDRADDADAQGDDRFWGVELQYMLTEAGHRVPGRHEGNYGPATTAAVSALQADAGADSTGEMDAATWSALKRAVC